MDANEQVKTEASESRYDDTYEISEMITRIRMALDNLLLVSSELTHESNYTEDVAFN